MPIRPDARLLALGIGPRGADERLTDDVDVTVLLDAAARAVAETGLDPAEVAIVVAGSGDRAAVEDARGRGFGVTVRAEDPGTDPLVLAGGDDFALATEQVDPALTAVRVAWHPDDHPDRKKDQALALTRIAAWLHETGRQLMVEVVVGPVPTDPNAPTAAADAPDPGARSSLIVDAVRDIRQLGTEADLWGVEAPLDERLREALTDLARDAGRDEVRIVEVHRGPDHLASVGAVPAAVLDPAAWTSRGSDLESVTTTLTEVARRLARPT